jgi:hypothetical protein
MKFRPLPMLPLAVLFAWALCILLTGCSHGLDENTVMPRAMGAPIQLDNEQVSLSEAQVSCGIANELWEEVPSGEAQRTIYRVTDKGRALKFNDDIYVHDPEFRVPYTQVRGKFYLDMQSVLEIRDGPDEATKLIQAPIGVKISHFCFPDPLPLMGVAKGRFTAKLPPTLIYENGAEGWMPTKFLH